MRRDLNEVVLIVCDCYTFNFSAQKVQIEDLTSIQEAYPRLSRSNPIFASTKKARKGAKGKIFYFCCMKNVGQKMGEKLMIFESRIQRKRSIPPGRA